MKNEREFYKCSHCGNLVSFLKNAGVPIMCCGKPMDALKANTEDASQEKHLPVLLRNNDKLKVTVGSVLHPMTEEHHIAWIVVAEGERTTRVNLSATGLPEAEFCVGDGPVTVYEYCNLHGLWAVDL